MYPFPPLAQHECIVSERIAFGLGLKEGDYILIKGDFYNFHALYAEHWDAIRDGIKEGSEESVKRYSNIRGDQYMPF
jgi:hypothetical protein